MADIQFNCPHCHQPLVTDASDAGLAIDCPTCQVTLTVPSANRSATPHRFAEEATIRCQHCNAKCRAGTNFCSKCGFPLSPVTAASQPQPHEAEGPRYSKAVPHQPSPANQSWVKATSAVILIGIVSVLISVAVRNSSHRGAKTALPVEPPQAKMTVASHSSEPDDEHDGSVGAPEVRTGWIRGRVHIVFKGFDLPLKQVPVYLISASDAFASSYLDLKRQILPLLDAKDASQYPSPAWTSATEVIIAVEKRRASLFRAHTFKTVHTDNQGLFVFHDVPPAVYLVFVEGTIKDQMAIWLSPVPLHQGEDVTLDFGPSNAGDTRAVYSWSVTAPQGTLSAGEQSAAMVPPLAQKRHHERRGGFSYIPPKGWDEEIAADTGLSDWRRERTQGVANFNFQINPGQKPASEDAWEQCADNSLKGAVAAAFKLGAEVNEVSRHDFATASGERGKKLCLVLAGNEYRVRLYIYTFFFQSKVLTLTGTALDADSLQMEGVFDAVGHSLTFSE